MFKEIDASSFEFNSMFYDQEFEIILQKITLCYKMMIKYDVKVPNDENKIRDILLLQYLKNDKIRKNIGITDYHFDRETPEDNTTGITDIRIITQDTFTIQAAYYIIECKRLNNQNLYGISGLNAGYIKEGILRFVNSKYSAYFRVNGMIGFVVDNLNIEQNIKNINTLLKIHFSKANTKVIINKTSFIKNFEYQYFSVHNDNKKSMFKLYHLMFDFSNQINNSI